MQHCQDVIKVLLFGDSITQGLGSKRINFTNELADALGPRYQVINLAKTGTTIFYPHQILDQIVELGGGENFICVILYGNVDAQIRPNRHGRIFPHIPERYQLNGMLMPRPFYSHSPLKAVGQHLDNLIRSVLSNLIRSIDGVEQWVSLDDFAEKYRLLLTRLNNMGARVCVCSCVYIDDELFPGCQEQYLAFNEVIKSEALSYKLPYVDLYGLLAGFVSDNGWDSCYNEDHFHPNGNGYKVIADEIAGAILGNGADVSSDETGR